MPRTCTICAHTQRSAIEGALIDGGGSFRNIASRFGTSSAALVRHKTDHLPAYLAKAKEAEEVASADTLLRRLVTLTQETMTILHLAKAEKNHELALRAIARAERQLELEGKLLGELQDGTNVSVNVLLAPEWQAVQGCLLHALAPYPEARLAVVDALKGMDAKDNRP